MMYVYDILLNFTDGKIFNFYEWKEDDLIDHIKKIPLYRVNSKTIDDFINNDFLVTCDFIEKIKGKTLVYKNKNIILYGCLFSDNNRVVAVEFNDLGESIYKSFLIVDEEDDVCNDAYSLEYIDIDYKIYKKNSDNLSSIFLTRSEAFKQKYLISEINYLYKNNMKDKFKFLFLEIFDNYNDDISINYNNFISEIINNYDKRFDHLYDTVRLSYSKKKIS